VHTAEQAIDKAMGRAGRAPNAKPKVCSGASEKKPLRAKTDLKNLKLT